jgi:hypothetical protein
MSFEYEGTTRPFRLQGYKATSSIGRCVNLLHILETDKRFHVKQGKAVIITQLARVSKHSTVEVFAAFSAHTGKFSPASPVLGLHRWLLDALS